MTDAIDNAIDDMLLARAAGTGLVLEDSEFNYPPAKWEHEYTWDKERPNATTIRQFPHAAQPGHMPTVTDTLTRMHAAEARVTVLEAERDEAVALLRKLAATEPAYDDGGATIYCTYCGVVEADSGMPDHAADCAWRLAKEWEQRQEASNG